MKHKEKMQKKHAKREFKLHEEVFDHHHQYHDHESEEEDEPDFATYAEYKAWKADRKDKKYIAKELRKEEKHHYKFEHPHEYHGGLIPRFAFDEEIKTAPKK